MNVIFEEKKKMIGSALYSKLSDLENEATLADWMQNITKAKLKSAIKSGLQKQIKGQTSYVSELQSVLDEIDLL